MHWTRIAKDISYVLAPILIVILLATMISISISLEFGGVDELPHFVESVGEETAISVVEGLTRGSWFIIPFNTIALFAMIPIVIIGVGRKKDSKEIILNFLDKVHFELVIAFTFFAMFSLCGLFLNIANSVSSILSLILFVLPL